jgi:hypothetical protein
MPPAVIGFLAGAIELVASYLFQIIESSASWPMLFGCVWTVCLLLAIQSKSARNHPLAFIQYQRRG